MRLICCWPSKGATAWEAQFGTTRFSLWFYLRYPRYWRTSGIGFVRVVNEEGEQ